MKSEERCTYVWVLHRVEIDPFAETETVSVSPTEPEQEGWYEGDYEYFYEKVPLTNG